MTKFFRAILILMMGLLGMAQMASAEDVLLDNTDTTQGWMVFNDAKATGSVSVGPGPNSTWKALVMNYNLTGGNWVSFVKKIPAGMQGMKTLVFYYRGQGKYNLEIKVQDGEGATFGLKIIGGSEVPKWKKLVIPIGELKYLWGGTAQTLNPANIRQFEIAVSTDGGGGPGKMMVSHISYSMETMKAELPAGTAPAQAKVPETTTPGMSYRALGNVDIGAKTSWSTYADKGAVINIDIASGPAAGEKALQAKYHWGQRAIPGVQEQTGIWVAFVKDIGMDLSDMRNMSFVFRGTGSAANLEVKLADQYGARYGRVFPNGSTSEKWTTISIPRSDFNYMWGGDGSGKFDWNHVKALEISLSRTGDARDSGTFEIAEIHFESAVSVSRPIAGQKEALTTVSGQIKVIIDDFTDLNPTNRYFVVEGDDSTLQLDSSRITFQSEYSMRMRYTLKSSRPIGSWVEAQRRFSPALDWTGVENVRIWVKGDGSRNIFRISITDGEGRVWVNDNNEVLASTDWFLVDMPVETFMLYQDLYARKASKRYDLSKQLHTVRQLGISVISQPDRSSQASGEIFVEQLYVVGRDINVAAAVPIREKPPVGIAVPLKNWNIGGTSTTTMENLPSSGNNITQSIKPQLTGNFKKFSVFTELDFESLFGNESDGIRSQSAAMTGSNVSVILLDPFAGVSNVIVGNLWFDDSQHIFANNNRYGGWGFKGIQAEGWVDGVHHRTYFLKHKPDSYTLAGHYALTAGNLNFNLVGAYYNQSPFIPNGTKLEEDDKAFLFDVTHHLIIPNLMTLNTLVRGGYDWYQKYWDVQTQSDIDKRDSGLFMEGELNFSDLTNIFWPGLSFTGHYRYVDTGFKPQYRDNPYVWDDEIGDTNGYMVQLYQDFSGAFLTAQYYKYNRLSNPDNYLEDTIFSVGYNDWSSVDLSLTQEFKTKIYQYSDTRFIVDDLPVYFDDNRSETRTTLAVAYHFSGSFIVQEQLQFNLVDQFALNQKYTEMFSTIKVSYTPAPNITYSIENRFSRYGREQDVPVINIADPSTLYEYTRARIDLTF